MATIFVTGGAGSLGSRLCARLAAAGHLPVAYDNLSRGAAADVEAGILVLGDMLDRERLDEALSLHAPDAVVHLATVGEAPPDRRYACEVGGALTLLEAMRARGIDRLAFASGAGAAAAATDPAATDPAATAQRMVEQMLADAGFAHGLRSVTLRLAPNAAGTEAVDALAAAIEHLLAGGTSAVVGLGQDLAREAGREVA
jgi:UDP-glucose 4-epimerase